MKKIRFITIIIISLFISNLSFISAMEEIDHFDHLDEKNGAVNAMVSCTQDKQGFLWFGTEGGNGVFRYDGKTFQQFIHEPSNSNSILPGNVYNIICDEKGQLWFAVHGGGVSRYTPETGVFTNFTYIEDDLNSISDNNIFSLMEDSNNNIWISTAQSLDKYNPETGEFVHFFPNPDNSRMLQSSIIYHMYESQDGMIWLGTYGGGLNMYNPVSNEFTIYRHDPDNPLSISHDTCGAVVEDAFGNIWVGGKGGINRLDRTTDTFISYQHDSEDQHTIADNLVWDMVFDENGDLWVGGFGGGLGQLDVETGKVERYMQDSANQDSLSSNFIWFVYRDREDILWIGTPDGGLNKFAYSKEQFVHYRYLEGDPNTFPVRALTTVFQDSQNIFWVAGLGHDTGLTRWDRESSTIEVIKTDSVEGNKLPSGEILSISEDNNGDLLLGQYGGLTRYNTNTNVFSRIFPNNEDSKKYSDIQVKKIAVDKSGDIWAATEIGVVYTPKDSESYSVLFEDILITTVFADQSNNIWVGTAAKGLFVKSVNSEDWEVFNHNVNVSSSLSGGQINEIFQGDNGTMWIGTEGGLNRWNEEENTFAHFSTKDGFSSNVIYSILEDKSGYLWIGTSNGLIQFDHRNSIVVNYTVNNGLQSNEFSMRRDGAVAGKDGYFYFVGNNGMSVFDPLSISINESLSDIILTSVKVMNEEANLGVSPFALDKLDLTWKDSMVSFDFIALNFTNPYNINYAYMLEGFDKDWILGGNEATATYTNLDGGDYTFRVKVSIQPGVWSESELVLPVHIEKPWWETWWAILSYIILIVFAIVAFLRYRINRLARINRKLETEVDKRTEELNLTNEELKVSLNTLEKQSKELEATTKELMSKERLASLGNLVAGVSHEINTPLGVAVTASTYLSGKNEEAYMAIKSGELTKSELISYMKKVDESSEIVTANLVRASELVQSFKKIAVNQSSELATTFNLTDYINAIIMTLKHEYKNKSINIKVGFEKELWMDSYPSAFSQIFTNLIMNSLVHGFENQQSGEIFIDAEVLKDSIILTYKDNGKGILDENIGKVFDPFYTTNQHNGGSGLGLSIIYNIIRDKLAGSISCQSEVRQGTIFTMTLPIKVSENRDVQNGGK